MESLQAAALVETGAGGPDEGAAAVAPKFAPVSKGPPDTKVLPVAFRFAGPLALGAAGTVCEVLSSGQASEQLPVCGRAIGLDLHVCTVGGGFQAMRD